MPLSFLCLPLKLLGPIYDFQECVSDMATLFNYSGTPPYGHLVITATFFRPGKAAMHFFIKKSENAVTHSYGQPQHFEIPNSRISESLYVSGNCPPTPPLSQHLTLSENTYFALEIKCWLRGGVSGQFPRNVESYNFTPLIRSLFEI